MLILSITSLTDFSVLNSILSSWYSTHLIVCLNISLLNSQFVSELKNVVGLKEMFLYSVINYAIFIDIHVYEFFNPLC